MTLSNSQKQQAKEKAIAFLEKNIFNLSLVLGVDVDELTPEYIIPVNMDDPDYVSFNALVKMSENLRKLSQ